MPRLVPVSNDKQQRDQVDSQGDEDQHQAELDQRRRIERCRSPRRTRWRSCWPACRPGEKMEGGISSRLPMTMVTAIVSPERAAERQHGGAEDPGSRRRQDHAPRGLPPRGAQARTRLLAAPGTARITSRETAERVGRIITASTSDAVKMLVWRGVPEGSR